MNHQDVTTRHRVSLRAILGRRQFLFAAAILAALTAHAVELRVGNNYPLRFTDVDRHEFSTADGHVTVITVVTRQDEAKAQTVGDRLSESIMGDPKYRLITLVNFQRGIFTPLRGMVSAVIRHRLDDEAAELQKEYARKKINRTARNDLFVVADFDGKAVSQLGVDPASSEFAVFVFNGSGRLVRRWSDVPSAEAFANAIKEAR
jgi:hypothetical protein